MLMGVKEVAIGSITWFDHAPITLTLRMNEQSPGKMRQLRLNQSLPEDEIVEAEVIKELQYYFQYNTTPEIDVGIIWEAHKTAIRGSLIKHGSRIKRRGTDGHTCFRTST